jgi:hypothetical protein
MPNLVLAESTNIICVNKIIEETSITLEKPLFTAHGYCEAGKAYPKCR